jgi:flagellar motor protein MotB
MFDFKVPELRCLVFLRLSVMLLIAVSSSVHASKCYFDVDLRFEQNTAFSTPEQLLKVEHAIQSVQANNTVLAVIIVGHADRSEGPVARAEKLSVARAATVSSFVLHRHPGLSSVLYFEGKDSTQPISKRNEENRSVEVEVVCIVPPPYFFNGRPIS